LLRKNEKPNSPGGEEISEVVYEFEGKTEKEAIDIAVETLGLNRDDFDVELMETQKGGFLNLQKKVLIRVHTRNNLVLNANPVAQSDFEQEIVDFLTDLTEKMGYPTSVKIMYREADKIGIKLDSEYANILIGKKGKNLDAIQLLANVVVAKLSAEDIKVVIDTENYRSRREESLIRLAQKIGDQVKRTKKSRLLEPMNPFERRLIHTTLADISELETKSEGEGLYKQVRIMYRGYP
jgi:spoIIIJ-associated protein